MHPTATAIATPRLLKVLAAIIIGLSIGHLLNPEPLVLPALGTLPGFIASGLGLLTGTLLYTHGPKVLPKQTGCGCGPDCNCE